MRSFYQWLLREANLMNVVVDLSEYAAQIKAQIQKIEDYQAQKAASLKSFKFDPFLVRKGAEGYPNINGLISMLAHKSGPLSDKDDDLLDDEVRRFFTWYLQQPNNVSERRAAMTQIMDQQSLLKGHYDDPENMTAFYDTLVSQTQQNMEPIKAAVQQAIETSPAWNGSPIRIVAQPGFSENFANDVALQPGDDAHIYVGNAMFSLFNHGGKYEIDDIVEGGEDDEFFTGPDNKSDYYVMVNELRKPGSTNKGKILTLYTARPQNDRQFFMHTKWLPVNLFLTNSVHHADGLAHDLASGEPRDVWIVKMDSRYLTQTLDGPVKYYMVTKDQAPVNSMRLY